MVAATVEALAREVGAVLLAGDPSVQVHRVMTTQAAEPDALTFVTASKYLTHLKTSRAAAVLMSFAHYDRVRSTLPAGLAVLGVERPYVAFARAAQILEDPVPGPTGVHASSVIEPDAELAEDVSVGPFAYVGQGARIGAGAVLHSGVHVEAGAEVGSASILYNHVVIRHGCRVGARCILHPGVIIGADGFGFAAEPRANGEVIHVKIPQTGVVVVEDDVEIGANSSVDRGALGVTRIGQGTKIDNLVQVGHNVEIGPGSLLVAQSGVAGSSRLGRRVTLGAQSGISGHLDIGDDTLVLGQSGVMKNLPAGSKVAGSPAVARRQFFETVVRLRELDRLKERIRKLEARLAQEDESS